MPLQTFLTDISVEEIADHPMQWNHPTLRFAWIHHTHKDQPISNLIVNCLILFTYLHTYFPDCKSREKHPSLLIKRALLSLTMLIMMTDYLHFALFLYTLVNVLAYNQGNNQTTEMIQTHETKRGSVSLRTKQSSVKTEAHSALQLQYSL